MYITISGNLAPVLLAGSGLKIFTEFGPNPTLIFHTSLKKLFSTLLENRIDYE
jgi:hypothetical protein